MDGNATMVFAPFVLAYKPQHTVSDQRFCDVAIGNIVLMYKRVPTAAGAIAFADPLGAKQVPHGLNLFWCVGHLITWESTKSD